MKSIEERLLQLERTVRIQRGLALCILGMVVAISWSAGAGRAEPSSNRILSAHAFQVLDSSGNVRTELGTLGNGLPYFLMHDLKGQSRVVLGVRGNAVSGTEPFIQLQDEERWRRFQVYAEANTGKPSLRFYEAKEPLDASATYP